MNSPPLLAELLSTSHVHRDMDLDKSEPLVAEIGALFVQTVICVVGTVLNLVTFFVLRRSTFGSATYVLMTALALTDAVTLALRTPQGYLSCSSYSWCCSSLSVYIYYYTVHVEVPLTNMSECVSVYLTVAMAVERYITMRHYHVSRSSFMPPRMRRLTALILLVSVIMNLPFFFLQKVYIRPARFNVTVSSSSPLPPPTNHSFARVCLARATLEAESEFTAFYNSSYYSVYSWARVGLVQILPLIFLCVFNFLLLVVVCQHNRRFQRRSRLLEIQAAVASASTLTNNHAHNNRISINPDTISLTATFNGGKRSSIKFCQQHKTNVLNVPTSGPPGTMAAAATYANQQTLHPSTPAMDNFSSTCQIVTMRSSWCLRNKLRAQRKLTILLIAIVFLFLLGQIPQAFAYMKLFPIFGVCPDEIYHCSIYQVYRTVTQNLTLLSYASNFFLYLSLNVHFRHALAEGCLCRWMLRRHWWPWRCWRLCCSTWSSRTGPSLDPRVGPEEDWRPMLTLEPGLQSPNSIQRLERAATPIRYMASALTADGDSSLGSDGLEKHEDDEPQTSNHKHHSRRRHQNRQRPRQAVQKEGASEEQEEDEDDEGADKVLLRQHMQHRKHFTPEEEYRDSYNAEPLDKEMKYVDSDSTLLREDKV